MDWPSEQDAPGARELPPVRHGVRVEDAHFRYADGTPALRGVSFEARVGAVTALVGPVGSGKTTLVSLLPRFLSPSAGRVEIDGVDVESVTLASLRARTAFVFQETVLFDASIEENLRLGRPDASDEEIRRAARSAGADDFVRALPDGYRTRLGRAGGKLSGGQKQRLAIARALVRDAGILILDEPTSALDPESEARIIAALHEAARTRVVIVIAHRLSSIRAADTILFLEHGRIVERGTPRAADEPAGRRLPPLRRATDPGTPRLSRGPARARGSRGGGSSSSARAKTSTRPTNRRSAIPYLERPWRRGRCATGSSITRAPSSASSVGRKRCMPR